MKAALLVMPCVQPAQLGQMEVVLDVSRMQDSIVEVVRVRLDIIRAGVLVLLVIIAVVHVPMQGTRNVQHVLMASSLWMGLLSLV